MKTAKGFTLIEVLCVLGILASLAAILFPTLASSRRSAKTAVALANIRSTGQSILLYSADHDDHAPYGADDHARTFPWLFGIYEPLVPRLPLYTDLVSPYAKSREIYFHPLDEGTHVSERSLRDYVREPSLFKATGSSFLYNVDYGNPSLSSVDAPSETPMLETAAGFWQCGCDEISLDTSPAEMAERDQSFRYAVCMADGRATTVTYPYLHRPVP